MTAHNVSSLDEYLFMKLGPRRLDLWVVVPITVVYLVIFVTGIVGNACTCLVIVRNRHMHSATNCYLFSLAVADLLILILGLPNDLSVYWQQYPYLFGTFVCKIRAHVSEMTSNASILTIVAFTTERYIAVCRPLTAPPRKSPGVGRVIRLVTIIWIVACASALPFSIYTTVNQIDYPEGSGQLVGESSFCSVSMGDSDWYEHHLLFLLSSLIFFVIPLFVITGLYIKIGFTLRASSKMAQRQGFSDTPCLSDNYKSLHPCRRTVLRILVAVVIVFFVCWAPFHTQRLLYVSINSDGWTEEMRRINETLYHVAGCCYYLNCTTNPILYNVMSKKYRDAFQKTLFCCQSKSHSKISSSRMSSIRWTSIVQSASVTSNGTRKSMEATTERGTASIAWLETSPEFLPPSIQ